MGIHVEFNPDLALRDYAEFEQGIRKEDECVPRELAAGKRYPFLKKGQRIFLFNDDPFWGKGELPLVRTEGGERLSRPVASIKIIEATHFLHQGEVYTRGVYQVIAVFTDDAIHFESYKRVN